MASTRNADLCHSSLKLLLVGISEVDKTLSFRTFFISPKPLSDDFLCNIHTFFVISVALTSQIATATVVRDIISY